MELLFERLARFGWRVEHIPEGVLLLGNGSPAVFRSEALLLEWLGKQKEPKTMQPYYEEQNIQIYHGDCRALTLPEKPALVLTDPPYGIDLKTDYAARKRGALARCNDFAPVAGDDESFDPSHLLKLSTLSILWGANYYADKLPPSSSWIVWDKLDGLTSKREFGFNDQADLEMAWSNLGGPARICGHRWMGAMKGSEQSEHRYHPTQKPVALMAWCLRKAALLPGSLVYDPYMGSGPVALACKALGLRYIGCEIVKGYCDTTVQRLNTEFLPALVDNGAALSDLPLFSAAP